MLPFLQIQAWVCVPLTPSKPTTSATDKKRDIKRQPSLQVSKNSATVTLPMVTPPAFSRTHLRNQETSSRTRGSASSTRGSAYAARATSSRAQAEGTTNPCYLHRTRANASPVRLTASPIRYFTSSTRGAASTARDTSPAPSTASCASATDYPAPDSVSRPQVLTPTPVLPPPLTVRPLHPPLPSLPPQLLRQTYYVNDMYNEAFANIPRERIMTQWILREMMLMKTPRVE